MCFSRGVRPVWFGLEKSERAEYKAIFKAFLRLSYTVTALGDYLSTGDAYARIKLEKDLLMAAKQELKKLAPTGVNRIAMQPVAN
jgi:hypothetical protein